MNKRADPKTDSVADTEKQENIKKLKSKKSVYIYIAALFLIVFLFILLSYFIQQRNNSALHTAQQNIENLQTTNLQLQAENDAYKTTISELEKKVDDLKDQVKEGLIDIQTVRESDTAQYNVLFAQYNELLEKYEAKGSKK